MDQNQEIRGRKENNTRIPKNRSLQLSKFERFKKKYGLVIITLAYITLAVMVLLVFLYAKELSTEPIEYAAQKYDLKFCYANDGTTYSFENGRVFISSFP